jgi:hypothetical protein
MCRNRRVASRQQRAEIAVASYLQQFFAQLEDRQRFALLLDRLRKESRQGNNENISRRHANTAGSSNERRQANKAARQQWRKEGVAQTNVPKPRTHSKPANGGSKTRTCEDTLPKDALPRISRFHSGSPRRPPPAQYAQRTQTAAIRTGTSSSTQSRSNGAASGFGKTGLHQSNSEGKAEAQATEVRVRTQTKTSTFDFAEVERLVALHQRHPAFKQKNQSQA